MVIDSFRDTDYIQVVYDLLPELRTQERGYLRTEKFPDLKRVFFLGPEKHRGMYSMPELLALSRMTSEEDYRKRQDSLDPHDVVNMLSHGPGHDSTRTSAPRYGSPSGGVKRMGRIEDRKSVV